MTIELSEYVINAIADAVVKKMQQPCEDAVSRQIISDYVESHIQEINTGYGDLNEHTNRILRMIVDYIEKMESVTSQPKTGHWIDIMVGGMPAQACDRCNTFYPSAYTGGGHKYCPNCGAKMESEG